MPARRDIESVCVIGSGPIVIGQACEFDYAGCQALKVLREDGYRTIVVNSNPATIMTDPGFADRTYIEPLDLESVASVLERERPDALLPTLGGQTALEPRDRARPGGRPRGARSRADRRAGRGDPPRRGSRAVSGRRPFVRPGGADLAHRHLARRARGRLPARGGAPGLHPRRPRRGLRRGSRDARAPGRARPRRVADRPGAGRGVGQGLGRVRARGDPRPSRQRGRRLLDREPRPDGSAHGRLGHRRPADDALRRGLPGAQRRRGSRDPRRRGRDRRLEHPVCAQP